MSNDIHKLALLPRDGFFCNDGRGWHTSTSGRSHALDWPWPSTLRGALVSAWGREQENQTGKTKSRADWLAMQKALSLGPTLALRRPHAEHKWQQEHRLWPVPADALWLHGERNVFLLNPEEGTASTLGCMSRNEETETARECLWLPKGKSNCKPRSSPRWLCETDFVNWLCGEAIRAGQKEEFIGAEKRVQAHVGIDEQTLAAKESILFSHDVVEMLDIKTQWAIGAQVELKKSGAFPTMATLGSDGHLAHIDRTPVDELFEAPQKLVDAFKGECKRLRLITVTPTLFEKGWLPDGFEVREGRYIGILHEIKAEVILRAAFVPRPVAISGWDLDKWQPKPTARMVPPGAVYFFEKKEEKSHFSGEEVQKLWLVAMGERQEEGFGRVVPGIWNLRGNDNG